MIWLVLAWIARCVVYLLGESRASSYLALALTACAGIAVLGARRPGYKAWNFVVGGLFLALCRPFLAGFGEPRLEPAHLVFLALVLTVGVGNYLPTRGGLAALLLAVWCGVEVARLGEWVTVPEGAMPMFLALVPWVWHYRLVSMTAATECDRSWNRFREGFGFLWAQRMREQFNRSATNASVPMELHWSGMQGPEEQQDRASELLRAVLQRFDRTGE
jgi:hypothetical protein